MAMCTSSARGAFCGSCGLIAIILGKEVSRNQQGVRIITTPAALEVPLRMDERGNIRIGPTRVLLDLVIHAFEQGETPETILDAYPSLSLAELYAVLACYLAQRDAVDNCACLYRHSAG
jgi:uncharacterized protein (DUF433 family)